MNDAAGPVVAVVQARMGSQRFPGKMLAPLGGRPVLEWVLRRVLMAHEIDIVVLATSVDQANDGLAAAADTLGVRVVRGDEHDVLSRFVEAAQTTGASWIVRVCADNPFVDPAEIDRLVRFGRTSSVDYTFNHVNRLGNRYADGFGAEMVRADVLSEVGREAHDPTDREHVTTFLWRQPDRYRVATVPAPLALQFPELRFDVDTPADLVRLEAFAPLGLRATAAEVVARARACAEPQAE
jgi:spore coat polysaccharide biosynthesis protein SpsF